MALPTRNDEKSRIDQGYETGLNSGNDAYVEAGLDQAEAYANDPKNHDTKDDVKNAEESGAGWDSSQVGRSGERSSTQLNKPKLKKALAFAKKRGGIIGLISLFGIGGGLLAGFLGPASMLINLTENFTITNDSSSTAMERRFTKIFGNMTDPDNSGICTGSTNPKMKCRMGKLSNNAIRALNKKGVVAMNGDQDMTIKRTGYPEKNPTHYRMPNGDTVEAKNLSTYLADRQNSKVARQIMGPGGAFNLKARAWTGKHITNKLYNKFGLDRRARLADGQNKGATTKERLSSLKERVKTNIPGSQAIGEASTKITDKVKQHTGKAKKGGAAYVVGVAGCISLKAPAYIAAGVAAVQLAQVMPMAMDFVMSPGHKTKAMEIGPDDMETLGSALTNQTENADGKLSSALDSPYLLAAAGINTGKPSPSSFSPGYSVMTDSALGSALDITKDAEESTRPLCNVILSPAAMWAAIAVNVGVTTAASATVVGGLAVVAVNWTVGAIAGKVAEAVMGDAAKKVLTKAAENNNIPEASGEELGDVIGIGAMAMFSSGGMARHLPTLSEGQLVAYDQIRQENEAFHRDMDIASLSPFDTSSRYTFLGSIVNSMQMASLSHSGSSPLSVIGSLFTMPSIISSTASATLNQSQNMCGYAEQFDMDTDNPATTPAINVAGMPCTGITPTQANMSTEEALTLLESEDWVDNSKDIPEEATIEDLMGSYIKKDTPFYEFIESCSNAETGDYLFGSSGCIAQQGVSGSSQSGGNECATNSEGEEVCVNTIDLETDEAMTKAVKNPRSTQAMSVFLLDFQIAQSVNGFDEEDKSGMSAGNTESTGVVVDGSAKDLAQKLLDSPNVSYWDQGRDASDKSRPSDNLRSIAAGELASTSTRGPAGGKKTALDPRLLQFLVELSEKTSFQINALAGQKHMANSNHYSGTAVDFQCGHNLPDIADSIAAKYGVKRNHETCAKHSHWHYDVVGPPVGGGSTGTVD